jgi:hypothetical protein
MKEAFQMCAATEEDFARFANELSSHNIPYLRGGKDPNGMDSAGFIEYCLRQNGVAVSLSGTNDLYHNEASKVVKLDDALRQRMVTPGVILLHVEMDGNEPDKYKGDGKGNCTYASICVEQGIRAYPSSSEGKMIRRKIEISGKENYMMLLRCLDYDEKVVNPDLSQAVPSSATVKGGKLILRAKPSKSAAVICSMPEGSMITLVTISGEWAQAKYTDGNNVKHDGWCMTEYLNMG